MRVRALFFASFLTLLGGEALLYAKNAAIAAPVDNQAIPNIGVRAGVHPGFDRIVFDWPRNVPYKVTAVDGKVTISFTAAARPRFNQEMFAYLTRASGFSSALDQNGHLTISFSVGAKASVKDFTSDHSVVLDIEGDAAPRQPMIVNKAAAVATTANLAPQLATPTTTPAPLVTAPAPSMATTPASAAPMALAPIPVAEPAKAVLPQIETPKTDVAKLDAGKPDVAKTVPAKPETTKIDAAPASSTTPASAPTTTAPAKTDAPAKAKAADSMPEISTTPVLVAALDAHTPVRAVIYERANVGYIVFDRKLSLDLAALITGQPAPTVSLEALDIAKTSGFRFAIPPHTSIRATRKDTVWQIYLSKQQPDVPVSNNLVAQPDFALGSRYLLPLPDTPEPVHMIDPVVGDELVLVPLAQTEAFSVSRRLADFQILPAAQGLVIRPLTDKLAVRAVSDGLEITGEGGLHLSSANDTGASLESVQKLRAAATGKSMFAFNTWQGHPGETFTKTRQRLQQTIIDVPDAERNRARLELARFYFAHGYGEEAGALLQMLAKDVPDLVAHPDFLALLGATQILSYHADEGLQTLDTPMLINQPEIDLWRAVGHAELRDWKNAESEFSAIAGILEGYPEPFYSRFSVLAIESALAVGNDHAAADMLDKFEAGPHADSVNAAILYLRGVLHAKAGRASAAEQAWKDVAASRDRLYKIRAELALIDLGVSTKSLTPAQAADRLEAMRFGWRGDDLEIDILHRLGEFYIQAGNVRAGIMMLGQAVQLYPNSPLIPAVREEMQRIFHDVFLGDMGKGLSPLDALTLYQQFRDLMPPGKEGDIVIRNLAERLVAVDLLDQAAALLQDLVKTRLQGEDKARTGTRLAAIRLLDHKPDEALTALSYSDGETLSADLQNERLLLRARALSEQHHDDEALALLHDNNHEAAKMLRADITMHAQRWSEAAKALMELIGPPPMLGTKATHDQAEWLVSCAIAYALAGDQTGLDKLAIDYGAAMATTPENDTFRVLTEPEKTSQLQDIAAARSKIAEVDLFQGFLDSYRKTSDSNKKSDGK
jgi:tetratricopeptide (TPR) repeat protein